MLSKSSQAIKNAIDSGTLSMDENSNFYGVKGKRLTKQTDKDGYYKISVRFEDRAVKCSIHRIIAYMKYGDIALEKHMHVHHINRNRLDNRPENIELLSESDHKEEHFQKINRTKQWFPLVVNGETIALLKNMDDLKILEKNYEF